MSRGLAAVDPQLLVNGRHDARAPGSAGPGVRGFVSALSSIFAALGLVLSAVGLYGIISYSVVRRTAEIGVRMTLGATAGSIRALTLGEALRLVAGGLAIGIPLSVAAKHALRGSSMESRFAIVYFPCFLSSAQ